MTINETIIILVGSFLTLSAWSYLYKENPFFTLFESILIGVAAGYMAVIGFRIIINEVIMPILAGEVLLAVPLIIGLLLMSQLLPGYAYLSRWALAFIAGIGTGLAVKGVASTMIIPQVLGTIQPFYEPSSLLGTINNIIVLVGVATCLFYFVFTFTPTGATGRIFKISATSGRMFLLILSGAVISGDYLPSMAYVIERTEFLIFNPPGSYLVPIALLLIIYDYWRTRTE
ncbi:hypothetical protein ACFL0D_05365 [Thermoproteota archaeon]